MKAGLNSRCNFDMLVCSDGEGIRDVVTSPVLIWICVIPSLGWTTRFYTLDYQCLVICSSGRDISNDLNSISNVATVNTGNWV